MPTALNDLLKATSRSFYLTLRVLPARVRPQPVAKPGLARASALCNHP
jgi:phytoene/squalene synthetase